MDSLPALTARTLTSGRIWAEGRGLGPAYRPVAVDMHRDAAVESGPNIQLWLTLACAAICEGCIPGVWGDPDLYAQGQALAQCRGSL